MYRVLSDPAARGLRLAFCLVAGAIVCACGGGGREADISANAGAVDAAPASLPERREAAAVTETWTQVAWENQPFTVSGTQTVRYGANATWITRTVTDGGTCSNTFFGNDPLVGVFKQCQVSSVPPTTWQRIAWENQPFTLSGTQTVRYGANASWITRTLTGAGTCSNAFFGNDPLVGVFKQCQVSSVPPTDPPPSTWQTIASENQPFTVSGTQTVRYGVNVSWITRSVTGSGTCSNAFFGSDPAYGVVKSCQVASGGSPAPKGRSGIGMNLEAPVYWQSDWPFINEFKRAGGWYTSCQGWVTPATCTNFAPGASAYDTLEQDKVPWDENGYARRLPAIDDATVKYRLLTALLFQGNGGTHAAGRWVVLYDGDGTLQYSGAGRKVDAESKPGRDVVEVTNDPGIGMLIQVTRINEADHLRNIRVIGPGGMCDGAPGTWVTGPTACSAGAYRSLETLSATQAFHPAFVGDLTGMGALRFTKWNNANMSRITSWAQRAKLSDAMWDSDKNGVPYEAMFELSRLTGADPWVHVPPWVDDDFVRQLGQLARQSLAPGTNLYFEYGNEPWNTAWPWSEAGVLFEAQAKAKWPGATMPVWQQRLNWYAYRLVQMCRIVKTQFGAEASRVKCVAGSQAAYAEVSRTELACELAKAELGDSCGHLLDALAVGPYFGLYMNDSRIASTIESWTYDSDGGMDKIFREITGHDAAGNIVPAPLAYTGFTPPGGGISQAKTWIVWSKEVADQYGLPMVAYETGQHMQTFVGGRTEAMFHAAQRDPRMGAALKELADVWKAAGGQLWVPMSYAQFPGRGYFWGMKEHQRDDTAPKWQAMKAMRDESCWWTGCTP